MTLQGKTIIVADDDEISRRLMQGYLQKAGCVTVPARNGHEVLALHEKQQVDLVLLDVMMPEMDGYATLSALRERDPSNRLPVIMLTALDETASVIKALRHGANDYATKPLKPAAVMASIETLLGRSTPQVRRIGRYTIQGQLGSGNMATVHSAVDILTGARVALKVLPDELAQNMEMLQRFQREATLLAQVRHPNVVRFLAAGHEETMHFLAMERIIGITLEEWVDREHPGPHAALHVARQIVMGLLEMARAGIVHRDIKPRNVLLEDGTWTVKIVDFGIARCAGNDYNITQSGTSLGSPIYASYEQLEGKPEMRSDMYSFGATLFFLLTGSKPFRSNEAMAWYFEQKTRKPPSIRQHGSFTPELVQFVERLMQPKPKNRFENYDELLVALDAAAASLGPPPIKAE